MQTFGGFRVQQQPPDVVRSAHSVCSWSDPPRSQQQSGGLIKVTTTNSDSHSISSAPLTAKLKAHYNVIVTS